jgi:DNA repair exonuclease SbcCD ATPase subunit
MGGISMIITRISFKNFKNFKEQTVDFGSGVNTIARQNRWGKTTIADGIAFAFVGKKYDGSSDVASFKTISDTKATATVELTVKLSSGRELTIRKDYYENWVKTRGTTDSILQGHLTDCYIDGIFKPVAEFNKEICALFGVKELEMVQVLTNPYYFSQVMDWKKRREIVNLVIGEVIPEDVFMRTHRPRS